MISGKYDTGFCFVYIASKKNGNKSMGKGQKKNETVRGGDERGEKELVGIGEGEGNRVNLKQNFQYFTFH